mgnify:CR=1 FL=1
MPTRSGRATFNFKAVVQATGVKADTLRAWERRYGLPCPQRTPGGHRLFAQRDIDTVHWLKARLLEGMTISRAAALWHNLEAEGHDPLIALPAVPAGGPQAFPVLHGPALEHAREVWLEACLRFQEAQAEAAIAHALAQYPAEVVAVEVLSRGLAEIGERWYRADVSVHQEHFTSALAARRLEALITALPQPSLPGTLLVGAAPDDLHGFAPLLLTYLLRRRGRRAIFMGVDIPLGRFEQALQQAQPDFVILSAQRLPAAANLSAFGQLLAGRSIPFAFAVQSLYLATYNIYKKIAGFCFVFAISFVLLYYTHPAFKFSATPVVIILAFVIIHVYMTTTGHTVFGYIKGMITGWEDTYDD